MADKNSTGMEKPDMKKALNRSSKEKPIHCALGVGENMALALLLLDVRKAPRALETELKKEFPDVKNSRFGLAFVDEAEDGNMVQFQLNKPVSSMAKRLVKTLKKTGFTKVRILSEDGSLVEELQEADEDAPPAGAAAAATPGATPGAIPPAPPAPPAEAVAADAKPVDVAELGKRLKALSGRVPGAAGDDAARKGELEKMVRQAAVLLQTGSPTLAANMMAQLEKALDASAAAPAAPPDQPAAAATGAKPADPVELGKRLKALSDRIPGVAGDDAARKGTLDKMVREAAVLLKTGSPTLAANMMAQLEKALAGGSAASAPGTDLAGTRSTWAGVRKQVVADVDKLRAALAAAYDGQAVAGEVLAKFGTTVAPMLARFDTRVEDALDGVMKADAAGRAAMLDQARAAVKDALAFASSDKLIGDLDDNPFVPLDIRAAATAALTAVQQAVQ